MRREQGRVHAAPHRHVHVVHNDELEPGHRPRTLDVELVERRQVHHADAVTHRQVLGVDDRRPPPGVPLVRAVHVGLRVVGEQALVRRVPLRALPAAGVEEHRPEGFLPGVERAAAHAALGAPLLTGVDDSVGLVEVLGAAGADVMLGALVGVEAADVAGVRIAHVWVSVGHPLGHQLGDPGSLLDPHRRRAPQVADLHALTEHRHGVGRQGQQTVDRIADLGSVEDLAHQFEGLLHLRVEVVGGEGQLGGAQRRLVVGGDLVGVVEDGAVGVAAHLHRA